MKKSNYKVSYYLVFSDPVNSKNDSVVYSTVTNQIYVVSEQLREQLEKGELDKISNKYFESLVKRNILVEKSRNELKEIVAENIQSIDDNKSLYQVIQPSAMCQLGCDYCGQDHKKINLSESLYKKIIDRTALRAEQGEYTNLHIGWFGGEPLMALKQMREMTPMLKAIASRFNMSYSSKVVTNGLSLKPKIFNELVSELAVTSIEITLDGTAEFHDQRRHIKGGGESFDLIFKNILAIVNEDGFEEKGCELSLRCNVDERNWEGVSPLIQLLAKHKLHKKLAYFYPIGVYSWGGNDAHAGSLTKEKFAAQEINWYIEMIEAGFTPSLLPNRSKQVCMAVSGISEMYDAYGNIFNCTEVSYTDFYTGSDYVLGNLKFNNQEFVAPEDRPHADWNQSLLEDKFPCHTCRMLPVCGGGCPKSWHEDMRACPPPKFNIKERLALAYVIAKTTDKDIFSNLDALDEAPLQAT